MGEGRSEGGRKEGWVKGEGGLWKKDHACAKWYRRLFEVRAFIFRKVMQIGRLFEGLRTFIFRKVMQIWRLFEGLR